MAVVIFKVVCWRWKKKKNNDRFRNLWKGLNFFPPKICLALFQFIEKKINFAFSFQKISPAIFNELSSIQTDYISIGYALLNNSTIFLNRIVYLSPKNRVGIQKRALGKRHRCGNIFHSIKHPWFSFIFSISYPSHIIENFP